MKLISVEWLPLCPFNNVSVNVLWRLSAWRGAWRRLWLPGGRHQAGSPPIGSAGQTSYFSTTCCCCFVHSVVVKLSSRRAVGARWRGHVLAATSKAAGRRSTSPVAGSCSSFLSLLDSSRESWLHFREFLPPHHVSVTAMRCSEVNICLWVPGHTVAITGQLRLCLWAQSSVCLRPVPSAWTSSSPFLATLSSNVRPVTAAGSTVTACRCRVRHDCVLVEWLQLLFII